MWCGGVDYLLPHLLRRGHASLHTAALEMAALLADLKEIHESANADAQAACVTRPRCARAVQRIVRVRDIRLRYLMVGMHCARRISGALIDDFAPCAIRVSSLPF